MISPRMKKPIRPSKADCLHLSHVPLNITQMTHSLPLCPPRLALTLESSVGWSASQAQYGVTRLKAELSSEGSLMGSGSTRPNNADEKMFAAMERGDQSDFKDSKPPKNLNKTLIKQKATRSEKAQEKTERLRALRLASEQRGTAE